MAATIRGDGKAETTIQSHLAQSLELRSDREDRLLPMAPEFALFLEETAEAARIMPAQLKELMRHESIETSLRYYVGTNAERTADACWEAFEKPASGAAPAPMVENDVSGASA